MKRSMLIELHALVARFAAGSGLYSAFDAEEAAYYNGKDSAYESASDELLGVVRDAVVTEEDVVVCPGPSFSDYNGVPVRMHELGSRPMHHGLFDSRTGKTMSVGCETCDEFVKAKT